MKSKVKIELLAKEIFAWQTSTGPMDYNWDNAHEDVKDRYRKAAALPTEERLKFRQYQTHREMNI